MVGSDGGALARAGLEDVLGHFVPLRDQKGENLRLLRGDVALLGAILGEIIELPEPALETHELPIAVAQSAVAAEQKMDRRARPGGAPGEDRGERDAGKRRGFATGGKGEMGQENIR